MQGRPVEDMRACLLQVNDISQLGTPIEVAQLILPRGSTLLATATQQVPVPPKQTPVGQVDLPPQTYYRCAPAVAVVVDAHMHMCCADVGAAGHQQVGN